MATDTSEAATDGDALGFGDDPDARGRFVKARSRFNRHGQAMLHGRFGGTFMNPSTFCLACGGAFFLVGLLSGAWKYLRIRSSADARAPLYVDLAHRSALLYAFAGALLSRLCERNAWSGAVNLAAAVVLQLFFATSVAAYILHGALGDTDNQFRQPHRLGRGSIPASSMTAFMVALIAAEVSAFLVIFSGFLVEALYR